MEIYFARTVILIYVYLYLLKMVVKLFKFMPEWNNGLFLAFT